jgi:hypothetical protein
MRGAGLSLGEGGMRDPNTVAAIVHVLRQAYDDEIDRVKLKEGLSLAVLIGALTREYPEMRPSEDGRKATLVKIRILMWRV